MKHVYWFAAFFLLLFAGDRLGGRFLQRQVDRSQFRYSRLYGNRAASDILLVGNSRGLTFYQPYIEEKTGKTSFNGSYNGLPMDLANVLIQDYLDRYPPPRLLVLDITTCDRVNDELLTGFLAYSERSPRLNALIRAKQPKTWWAGRVSALFRFNNEIFQRALYYRSRSDADWLLDRIIAPALAATAHENAYDLEPQEYLIQQLAEAVRAAQAKGVTVRLVIGPYFPGFQVKNLDGLKSAVERATGLSVYDYRAALPDPALFGDFMHANKKGAIQYIDLLLRDSAFTAE